ncbi:MAG: isopenicillin N synthase family dioxygenase [Alphaproteobacteria bacterium]
MAASSATSASAAYATAKQLDFTEIPVIDLTPLASSDPAGLHKVARDIREASTTAGFFYVRNHGVGAEIVADAFAESRRFFALPLEAKLQLPVNARHRGFIKVGEAKMYAGAKPDLKESFVFGLDLPESDPDVRAGKMLMGPNVWPAALPSLRPALDRYYAAIDGCGRRLLRAFAVSLDLPEEFFVSRYTKPLARGAIIYYPPQPPDLGKDQFGVGAHTDYGCITLLAQDMNGGLQVRNRAGEWVAAMPIADTFVINIGDLMARWTNDKFASNPHRVVNSSGRERYSIAMFYDPHYDTEIETITSCIGPGEAARYAPTTCGAYIKSRFDAAFQYRKP